jgi:hypothetical protein
VVIDGANIVRDLTESPADVQVTTPHWKSRYKIIVDYCPSSFWRLNSSNDHMLTFNDFAQINVKGNVNDPRFRKLLG